MRGDFAQFKSQIGVQSWLLVVSSVFSVRKKEAFASYGFPPSISDLLFARCLVLMVFIPDGR
jgi:hypothetical protein